MPDPDSNTFFLHIVSFDVPYPANYGGVMDVFYKITSLQSCGIKVILHCFDYGRGVAKELEKYCFEVHYYKRQRFKNPFAKGLPYIVKTRQSNALIERLLADNYPILFEGIHTTFYLSDSRLKDRFKIVRNHNIEQDYYKNLEEAESSSLKRLFFKLESKRLAQYETQLKNANVVLGISQSDTAYLKSKGINAKWVSAFHPNDYVDIQQGKGSYIFYHGNLAVAENDFAALFLVRKVFPLINLPVIIAGNKPSKRLRNEIKQYPHIKLKADLTDMEILEHIADAQVNVLLTFQATGIKLKLINTLFKGRHIVVNQPMVKDTGLASLCLIADNPAEIASLLFTLMDADFGFDQIRERKQILEKKFSNNAGAANILDILVENTPVKSMIVKQ